MQIVYMFIYIYIYRPVNIVFFYKLNEVKNHDCAIFIYISAKIIYKKIKKKLLAYIAIKAVTDTEILFIFFINTLIIYS